MMNTGRRWRMWLTLSGWAALLFLGWALPVLADDCLQDPLNANDCLRTPGTAQVIAGVTTVVVTVLVNGQEVVRTILQPRNGAQVEEEQEGEEEEPRQLQLQVITQGPSGELVSALNLSKPEPIYIQAWCEELGKGSLPAATATIQFQLTGGQGWVMMTPGASSHGTKVAVLQPAQPPPGGLPPESASVYVSATFEGQTVGASVEVQLVASEYRLRLY